MKAKVINIYRLKQQHEKLKAGVTFIIQPARCLFTEACKDKWTGRVLLARYLTQNFSTYAEISDGYGQENEKDVAWGMK